MDTSEEEAALNEAAYQFSNYNYTPNNKAAAISWAQTFISSQYVDHLTVDDLIATARKIEAYLDGGTGV